MRVGDLSGSCGAVSAAAGGAGATAGAVCAPVSSLRAGVASRHDDWLIDERPVALVFNGITHAVMLATPADLADLAYGFAFSEGLIRTPGEFLGVDEASVTDGVELRIEVAAACEYRLKERRRGLAGRTGCGLCGVDSLAQIRRELPTAPAIALRPQAVAAAQRALRERQALQRLTGAAHAAAWCLPDGRVHTVREDIGRHNALDKLIGALHFARIDPAAGFVCITSRASFEMVQKAAMLGVGALAATSAPSAMAVTTARGCNLALGGFVRDDDLVAYTFAERFGLAGARTPPPDTATGNDDDGR